MSSRLSATTELMELIFLQTPLIDVAACYTVCRTWQEIIDDSPKLQKALFVQTTQAIDTNNSTFREVRLLDRTSTASSIYTALSYRKPEQRFVHLNPLLLETRPSTKLYDLSVCRCKPVDGVDAYRNPTWLKIQAWREAYLTDPPVKRILLRQWKPCDGIIGVRIQRQVVLRATQALKLGQFSDLVESYCREDEVSEVWCRFTAVL